MLSTETIITFFTASILLGLAPGPDNLFVLTQSALHGRAAGILIMLGLCTGLVFHSAAVAFGVAALVQTSSIAFTALKYLGAAYLLYLAWRAFRQEGRKVLVGGCPASGHRGLYLRGILMNVTNPKVSIFFLAFLPQFTQADRGSVTLQILLLGGLFILATILVFGAVAILAAAIGRWLTRSKRAQIVLNRVAGTVFVGLALKLVVTEP